MNSVMVGIDPHKRSHTAVVVDYIETVIDEITISSAPTGGQPISGQLSGPPCVERPVRLLATVGLVQPGDLTVDLKDGGDERLGSGGRVTVQVSVDLVTEPVENALQDQLILGCEVASRSFDDRSQAAPDRHQVAIVGLRTSNTTEQVCQRHPVFLAGHA